MLIRELRAGDCAAIGETLAICGAFNEEEVRIALELLGDTEYPQFSVELDGRVRGWVCVGRTPLTVSTWHLYWICVHPAAQGQGVGRALEAHAAAYVRGRGGDRLVLETSGRPDYARVRRFYARAGYAKCGRIPDFYKRGDDCVIFAKVLK